VRVVSDLVQVVKIKDVPPVYPSSARSARAQGVVVIEATINREGRVEKATVLRSVPLLDQAALDAVRQWLFQPQLLNGAAIPVVVTLTVPFTLK
jgi:periplasmic protein TonB